MCRLLELRDLDRYLQVTRQQALPTRSREGFQQERDYSLVPLVPLGSIHQLPSLEHQHLSQVDYLTTRIPQEFFPVLPDSLARIKTHPYFQQFHQALHHQ
jgi:hypothetical protein